MQQSLSRLSSSWQSRPTEIMTNIVFFIACMLALGTWQVINSEKIILGEDELVGTCTGTCSDIPTLFGEHNCKKINSCRTNSAGWTRGFVRCDYCACECERETGKKKDILVEKKDVMFTEDDLFGTCKGKCYSKSGVVRTDFKDCQKVENCRLNKKGWTRGFVRCDYCTCSCVNTREAASYKLENVVYDMSELAKRDGKPTAMAQTILENHSGLEQQVSRELAFSESSSTSVTTSHAVETGLTVTVEGSAGVPGIGSVGSSVSTSLNYGFTTAAGEEKITTNEDQVEASITVSPHSSITALIIGHRVAIDIPFSADLVTTYTDGSKRTTHTTGMYNNVQTGQFRVQYSAAKNLE